ncbi:hypothetical protein LCGC14_1388340 [marine sediment metagenome]|uniref:Uncharacterized protein n=1 Tax=marine sediment metagenome TaxID=412755 RepID=A0A0F9KLG8_9ZZZZ
MYSQRIIGDQQGKLEKRLGFKLTRYPLDQVEAWMAHLDKAYDRDNKQLRRALTPEEDRFILNETLLSTIDYLYHAERYHTIELDAMEGGGLGKLHPWESQRIVLRHLAKWQEEDYDRVARKEKAIGILAAVNKARQLGLTAICRSLSVHRLTTVPGVRVLAGSIDEDKVMALYTKDKTIIENLPWWLRPEVKYDEKGAHIHFGKLASHILYQVGSQKSGVGQGRQFDVSHLTECASWPYPMTIENDFYPAIPRSATTLCILESTAQGRGNWWHDFTERIRIKGSYRWRYIFIPWYAEENKYTFTPPSGWKPSDIAIMHAKKVHETSPEWVGRAIMLKPEQLFWWESERGDAVKRGTLNIFLTNYCATPEESFQHTTVSAFSAEVLEKLRLQTAMGKPYDVRLGGI